ncbi:MAG: lipid IV(A) 3-deoxy-D-manno-octulosonic acid transferase [Gammaproteobacteria bacterium]|nr:lipid IV(A) 3-deoxy-D-manno-octulosonic acid transferase [Gammaproteobacteria bacterium]
MRLLYRLALYLSAPLVSLVFLWRGLRDRSYWRNFGERFGLGTPGPPGGIWLHAVSVGEVQACSPLVHALRRRHPDLPVTVTTFTPTGAARARALFEDSARVRYVPFDLPGAVRRFLRRVQPRLAVIFETELWPNLYRECARQRVPLVLASARLTARSAARYRRLGRLFADTLAVARVIAAQAPRDAERFRSLGADPQHTHVTGNLKFDFELPADIAVRGAELRARYAAGRALWVAGSTHAGEEETLLRAQRLLLQRRPGSLLVLAPRHPPRFAEVAQRLTREGFRSARRSTGAGAADADCEVLLLDTLGELLTFYAAADVAFVGGSLVPIGGHNLLEPAALGVPVLTGPFHSNSEDAARLLEAAGALQVIRDAGELAARLEGLLSDAAERQRRGAAARASVAANRGALEKLLSLIEPLL